MIRFLTLYILALLLPAFASAQMGTPIVTDSRIKTFVYNESDVYSILTHYGYQSNIEFGKREEVMTVSVGDRIAWQVVPAGRRLFIKALEEKAHTNMTVVTNKRAYQFDLRSSGQVPLHPSEELVYVVRFFYPDEQPIMPSPPIFSDAMPMPQPMPSAPPMPSMSPMASMPAPQPYSQAVPVPVATSTPLPAPAPQPQIMAQPPMPPQQPPEPAQMASYMPAPAPAPVQPPAPAPQPMQQAAPQPPMSPAPQPPMAPMPQPMAQPQMSPIPQPQNNMAGIQQHIPMPDMMAMQAFQQQPLPQGYLPPQDMVPPSFEPQPMAQNGLPNLQPLMDEPALPLPQQQPMQFGGPAPMAMPQMASMSMAPPAPVDNNFNYTFTGPDELAPIKIYDDGRSTYFMFQPSSAGIPQFFMIGSDGSETPVPATLSASGEMVVSGRASKFAIRRNGANVMVFNENELAQRTM